MTEFREIELKYALEREEDYTRLCEYLGPPESEWDQINHYFHSEDGLIPGIRGMIRIRVEKGKSLFAVKLGGMVTEGLLAADEYEQPWPVHNDSYRWAPNVLWDAGNQGMKLLEQEHGRRGSLIWAGKMMNHRRLFTWARGLRLEVDASLYPDGFKDFEVELETHRPEQERPKLITLLQGLNLQFTPQRRTKYQRFLEHSTRQHSLTPNSRKAEPNDL